ncbi:MAG: HEAT repeat domain-containing protein [Planctomycetota bacterium]|jgi:hypothetical protein
MFLTTLLLAAPCAGLLPAQTEQDPADSSAQQAPDHAFADIDPAQAAKEIRDALKSKDENVSRAVLENIGRVPSKLVTKEVAKGLKHKSQHVILAALDALRYNTDPSALDQLLKAKSNKTLQKDEKCAVGFALALGQKADLKCLKLLTDDLVATAKVPDAVLKAKIAAIGRIRHEDAVEAIIDYSKTAVAGGRRRGGIRNMMREAQVSLQVLTGADMGTSATAWKDWWYDSKKSFKMSEEEWPLGDARAQRQWDALWMNPEEKEEAEERARSRGDKKRQGDSDSSDEGTRPPKREKDGGSEGRDNE